MSGLQMNRLKCLLLGLFLFGLTACATGGTVVNHSFSFDTINDSPDVEVMDYQYGNYTNFETAANREMVVLGQVFVRGGVSGIMPVGDMLYVKWRDKRTHQIYQDKVYLKNRLPGDITDMTIHFLIKGSQLYVYLIYPGLKEASVPEGPVIMYRLHKQVQIYPDLPK